MKSIYLSYTIAGAVLCLTACDLQIEVKAHKAGSNYKQNFTWVYNGRTFHATFLLPIGTYEYYHSLSRTQPYNEYAREHKNHRYLAKVVQVLYQNIQNEHYSDAEVAGYFLSFVQSIPYVSDPIALNDWPKYPIETFFEFGDCEDHAAALSALCETYGIKTILIEIPGHEAVGIACICYNATPYVAIGGRDYYFAEATAPHYELGELADLDKHVAYVTILPVERTATFIKPTTPFISQQHESGGFNRNHGKYNYK